MIDSRIVQLCSLEGRRGIVSGGSQGIGLGIAKLLALAGAEVHSFSRSGKRAESFEHPNIIYHSIDITDSVTVEWGIAKVLKGNEVLDFLVNNAGITFKHSAQDFPEEQWQQMQDVNVSSLFRLCQLAYPFLCKSEYMGRIVNISSMAAHLGFSEVVPYCASKSAVLGLTRGLAVEWAPSNILVNSIAPGWIYTEMTETVKDEERLKQMLDRMALHKFGDAEDVGKAALFLISDLGKYISGQDIAVDGGALCYGY